MMVSLNLNFCSDALLHMEKTLTPHLFLLNSIKKQGRERTDRCTRPLMAISRSTWQPHLPVLCTLPPSQTLYSCGVPTNAMFSHGALLFPAPHSPPSPSTFLSIFLCSVPSTRLLGGLPCFPLQLRFYFILCNFESLWHTHLRVLGRVPARLWNMERLCFGDHFNHVYIPSAAVTL